MKNANITIRMSGEANTVTVDGRTFDRSNMKLPAVNHLRRLIVDAFRKEWQAAA